MGIQFRRCSCAFLKNNEVDLYTFGIPVMLHIITTVPNPLVAIMTETGVKCVLQIFIKTKLTVAAQFLRLSSCFIVYLCSTCPTSISRLQAFHSFIKFSAWPCRPIILLLSAVPQCVINETLPHSAVHHHIQPELRQLLFMASPTPSSLFHFIL